MERPLPTDPEPVWTKWIAAALDGIPEYRTGDGSRVDILTDEYAIEVEWVKKWKESIGQALLYSELTERKPAIMLLMRGKPSEKVYYLRAQLASSPAGITVFTWDTRPGR